jgi:hypothetical protein
MQQMWNHRGVKLSKLPLKAKSDPEVHPIPQRIYRFLGANGRNLQPEADDTLPQRGLG